MNTTADTASLMSARHDAVLIATGVYKARDIAAPGVGLTTPSYQLATGPQVYLGLYVGLMFGP